MESSNLRKLAASLREAATHSSQERTEKAAHVLNAVVALKLLQEKVRPNV